MVIDAARRRHFVADTGNGLVRFVDDATGISVILAGNQSSTTLPSTTPVDSRTVSLGRPVGLAVDPVADMLYVADEQRGQILQIESGPGQPSLVSVLLAGPTIQRPGALGVHRFANGQRVLFALDRGTEGTSAPASARPRVRVIDLDTNAQSFLSPTLAAGFEFRSVTDLALRPLADGGVDLYVLADVGEVAGDGVNPGTINVVFDFETDVHNGADGDGDGLIDFADPDARRPLQINVLRIPFAATGFLVTNNVAIPRAAVRHLRCYRRFPIVSVIHDPGCNPVPPGSVSPSSAFSDAAIEAMAVDGNGRVFLMDALRGTVRFAEFDAANVFVRSGIAAGIQSEFALPFDGNDPRFTRWNRPLDIQVDDLGNLFVVDTANNRVRRMWVGDIVGN